MTGKLPLHFHFIDRVCAREANHTTELLQQALGELEYAEREGHTGISVAANDIRALLGDTKNDG